MIEKEKLAIFDLDGTLFDTTRVNYCAYKEALAEFGIILDYDYFKNECDGKHYTEFLPMIMKDKIEYMNDVHRIKKERYGKNINMMRTNQHLFNIIEGIRNQYYIALVTTASRENTMELLKYGGYEQLFDYIVTQEDVKRLKPDPQGFLLAISHFCVKKKNVIIFEDSNAGIMAAKDTGAEVIRIESF